MSSKKETSKDTSSKETTFDGPYESAFDVLEGKGRAANLKVRSKFMNRLADYVEEHGLTQEEAANRFDVDQSRVSHLLNGRISKFTIDYLLNMCESVGIEVDVSFDGAHVDETH